MKDRPLEFTVLCRMVKYVAKDGTKTHGVDCPNRIDAPELDECLQCPGMKGLVSVDGRTSSVACDPFQAQVEVDDCLPNAPCWSLPVEVEDPEG